MIDLKSSIVSILISVLSAIIVFSATFGGLKNEVNANTEKLKDTVSQREVKLILDGQDKLYNIMEKRFDRIERKLDTISN